jgi:hypothetical protein
MSGVNWRDYEMRPTSWFTRLFTGRTHDMVRKITKPADDADAPPLNHMEEKPLEALTPTERRARRRRIEQHRRELASREPMQEENKRHAPLRKTETPMNTTLLKCAMSRDVNGVYRELQKAADRDRRPNESSAQAFTRHITAQDEQGQARRNLLGHAMGYPVTKQINLSEDTVTGSMLRRELPARYPGSATPTMQGARGYLRDLSDNNDFEMDENEPLSDEEEERLVDQSEDAIDELEKLARAAHARDPSRTKEQWFAKYYCDPQYASLARAERMSSMKKLYAR